MLDRVLDRVLAALPKELPTTVVTGAYRQQLEAHIASLPAAAIPRLVTCTFNPRFEQGIASSLQVAARCVDGGPLLLTFADLPYITAADYRRLLASFHRHPITTFAAFPTARGPSFGPPVIFAAADVAMLLSLTGDQGAKKLFAQGGPAFATVAIPAAARDIDRPEQLFGDPPPGE